MRTSLRDELSIRVLTRKNFLERRNKLVSHSRNFVTFQKRRTFQVPLQDRVLLNDFRVYLQVTPTTPTNQ